MCNNSHPVRGGEAGERRMCCLHVEGRCTGREEAGTKHTKRLLTSSHALHGPAGEYTPC